jgi:hypothetical protein
VASFLSQAARLTGPSLSLSSYPSQQCQLGDSHSAFLSSSSYSSGQPLAGALIRNVKRFRKNPTPSSRAAPTSVLTSVPTSVLAPARRPCVLALSSMDRVLPRETERQMQVRACRDVKPCDM